MNFYSPKLILHQIPIYEILKHFFALLTVVVFAAYITCDTTLFSFQWKATAQQNIT